MTIRHVPFLLIGLVIIILIGFLVFQPDKVEAPSEELNTEVGV